MNRPKGRPSGINNAEQHFGQAFIQLLDLRVRASVAAALAENALSPHPWSRQAFLRLVEGITKAASLLAQTNALDRSLNGGRFDAPRSLQSMMHIELTYSDEDERYHWGNIDLLKTRPGPAGKSPSPREIRIEVHKELLESRSIADSGDLTLTVRFDNTLPIAAIDKMRDELEAQLVTLPETGLDFDDFKPRPDWKSRPPESRDEVLWDLRVRMSVFVALFLELYREVLFCDPFLVFFLEPNCIGRMTTGRQESHVRTGLMGYRYLIDSGQQMHLKSQGIEIAAGQDLAVPFPDGLCGTVYLTGADSLPNSAENILSDYQVVDPAVREVESRILANRMMFELPVHVADLDALSPDGPELIVAIAVPILIEQDSATRFVIAAPSDVHEQRESAEAPGEKFNSPAELIAKAIQSPNPSTFEPGEVQVLQEVSRRLVGEFVRTPPVARRTGETLLGHTQVMRNLVANAQALASSPWPLLILGPSGSGKTLLAQMIHQWGMRKDTKLVSTSGASLRPDLAASELFGHVKGAFTGANEHKAGLIEAAKDGTLFIDDFDALPRDVQAMLLPVMEGGGYRRVGGQHLHETQTNVRFILATNANIPDLVANGMRVDFLNRVGATLRVPPLRERPDDIKLIARHFVDSFANKVDASIEIHPPVLGALQTYDWSDGEVRALQRVVELACGKVIDEASAMGASKLSLRQHHIDWALAMQMPRIPVQPELDPSHPMRKGEINANAAALGAGFDYVSFPAARSALQVAYYNIREYCLERIHADGHQIALSVSATAACEAGLQAIAADVETLIYTDLVHPNILSAIHSSASFLSAARGHKVPVRQAALRAMFDPAAEPSGVTRAIVQALDEATEGARAAIVIEHVAYEEGLRLPIEDIVEPLEAMGHRVLIDGAQAVGAWTPTRPLRADLFGCFHKFIGGPAGTGFLALRNGIDRLPYSTAYTTALEQMSDFPTTDIAKWEMTAAAVKRAGDIFGDPGETQLEVERFLNRLTTQLSPLRGTLDGLDPRFRSHILAIDVGDAARAQQVVREMGWHGIRVQSQAGRIRISMGSLSRLEDAQHIGSMLKHIIHATERAPAG